MGTVATLAVNVIANTGNMTKGLDKAERQAKGFGASFGASMKSMITPAAVAAAGVAAIGVAVMKIGESLKRLDELAKKSRALGISGQDLREFQHAAGLAGVEAAAFTSALQKMQKNIGDAVGGIGLAKDSLALVGLEIDKLSRLDATEQFLAIADKISKIQNASERAAVATAIFGRAGADLIPLMEQGSDAIREQMLELRELQGVLTDFDLEQVEAANDAMMRLGKAFEGTWDRITVEVAPELAIVVDLLRKVFKGMLKASGAIEKWSNVLLPFLPQLNIKKNLMALFGDSDWTAASAKEKRKQAEAAEERLADLKAAHEQEMKVIEEAAKAREALEKKGLKLTESLRNPMEMYIDTIADLNMMLEEGVIGWQAYSRAVEKAQEDIKNSEEFAAKEIRVAERQAVGAAIRGQSGTFSIQQKQQRALERIREEERLQLKQLKIQTALLQQLNNNVQTVNLVGI